jgi:hypothetical protein
MRLGEDETDVEMTSLPPRSPILLLIGLVSVVFRSLPYSHRPSIAAHLVPPLPF